MSNPYDPNQPPPDPDVPQNPYGQPQQPQQQPQQPGSDQPSYGAPPPPADPPAGTPPNQPYGGAPQQPYGQPAQGGYGGSFPATYCDPRTQQPPGKGMAITSLVLGIVGCGVITAVVSIVLGIVVLRRGKDGRDHGKGLAIAGIVLSVLWIIGAAVVAVGVAAAVNEASKYSSIDDLSAGTCITADGLSGSDDTVSLIKKVDCSGSHDGEVLATHTLSSSEASGYGNQSASQLCQTAVGDAGKIDVVTGSINVIGLTELTSPESGDTLACVAFNSDGSKLTGPLG